MIADRRLGEAPDMSLACGAANFRASEPDLVRHPGGAAACGTSAAFRGRVRHCASSIKRGDVMTQGPTRFAFRLLTAASALAVAGTGAAFAQTVPTFDVYGFGQVDYIQDFNRVDPLWEATLRPSKIPTSDDQFGGDGQATLSARQSRLGVQSRQDIGGRELFVKFEFDLYGVGDDAGQTTIRLRHAYGEWGPILGGQTNTAFMDGDIFPNTIDYWGPNGMVFVRNPQIRYTFKSGQSRFVVAIEKPNNDIDPGFIRTLEPVLGFTFQPDEEAPDLTGHYRFDDDWGHVQIAGILRSVGYEASGTAGNEPKGTEMGWGLNLTSNIKVFEKDVIHLGVVYGEGISNYMNDGGMDLGPNVNPVVSQPIVGAPPVLDLSAEAVPLLGLTAYFDHYWDDFWSSSIGWSQTSVDNTSFQTPDAYASGQYASANLLYTPDKRIMMGGELLWGQREDNNGAHGEDFRIQFTVKYNFSSTDFFK
jgi:hypothetical protein